MFNWGIICVSLLIIIDLIINIIIIIIIIAIIIIIIIYHNHNYHLFQKDIELQWDYGTAVYVTVPARLKNNVCGLCGNFNDNSGDDFMTPRGNLVEKNPVLFADSWKTFGTCPETQVPEDPCEINPHRKTWAEYACAVIKQPIFEACHHVVGLETSQKTLAGNLERFKQWLTLEF